MAQENSVTPEKELLRLIEDQGKAKKSVDTYAIRHSGLSLLSPSAWIGRLSFLRNRLQRAWSKGEWLYLINIKVLNKILVLFIFILALYFISDISFSMNNLKKMPELELKVQEGVQLTGLKEGSFLKKTVAYYFEKVRQRNIFKMGSIPTETPVKSTNQSKILEVTKNLKLVGISWSEDPDAMIEDTEANKTFFVKRGQNIGKIKIQAIFKDKVILSYSGEEMELK